MRQSQSTTLLILAGMALFGVGCESEEPPAAAPELERAQPASTQPSEAELASIRDLIVETGPRAAASLPAGHPPLGEPTTRRTPPGAATPPAAQTALKYAAPREWERQPAARSMRIDQYRLPRAPGDAEDGQLAVFYFGAAGGGGVEANLARWRGQFSTADGQPIPDERFLREKLEVNGLRVTFVDVAGSYDAGMMMPGRSRRPPQENYRMLAAIVETPQGPWFFKAVGPAATMASHREAFVAFLQTMEME